MGFFSWKTQDTDRSIANKHSRMGTFPVYMHDDKGTAWREDDYDGYGKFGGKDYYELLAEMNEQKPDRRIGITLKYHKDKIIYPQLTESHSLKPDTDFSKEPENCYYQGFFYNDIPDPCN